MKKNSTTRTLDDLYTEENYPFIMSLSSFVYSRLPADSDDPEAIQERYLRAMATANLIYTAAAHFVHTSPYLEDIAKAANMSPEFIMKLVETPEWVEAVRFFGFIGDPKPRYEEIETVPVPLREDFLLKKVFQKDGDVRLATYDGFIDARVKAVQRYYIVLAEDLVLNKPDVILAFPKHNMSDVKRGIQHRKSIVELGLKPIDRTINRSNVNAFARKGDLVECVMRNGLVVVGESIWISRYNLVLRVGGQKNKGGKVVLLYKHALHEFKVLKNGSKQPKASANAFNDEDPDEAGTSPNQRKTP